MRKTTSALPPCLSMRRSAVIPTPAKNMSSSTGLMVWSIPALKPTAAPTMDATTANSSPPVMGSGMLYLERSETLRLTSVPMSSTTSAAKMDASGSRLTFIAPRNWTKVQCTALPSPGVPNGPIIRRCSYDVKRGRDIDGCERPATAGRPEPARLRAALARGDRHADAFQRHVDAHALDRPQHGDRGVRRGHRQRGPVPGQHGHVRRSSAARRCRNLRGRHAAARLPVSSRSLLLLPHAASHGGARRRDRTRIRQRRAADRAQADAAHLGERVAPDVYGRAVRVLRRPLPDRIAVHYWPDRPDCRRALALLLVGGRDAALRL